MASCRDLIQRGPKTFCIKRVGVSSTKMSPPNLAIQYSLVSGALTVLLIKTQKTKSGLEKISLPTTKMIKGISRILPRHFLFVVCFTHFACTRFHSGKSVATCFVLCQANSITKRDLWQRLHKYPHLVKPE